VVLTSDAIRDPGVHDIVLTGDDTWNEAVVEFANDDISYGVFKQFGQFISCAVNLVHIIHKTELISDELYTFPLETNGRPFNPSKYRITLL